MSSNSVSPLRYSGGKGKLGRWLVELIQFNRISGGIYVEALRWRSRRSLALTLFWIREPHKIIL